MHITFLPQEARYYTISMNQAKNHLQTVGWREWISLPELNIEKIKAKIDTGAKTSTLHAFAVKPFKKDHRHWVKFSVHPEQLRRNKVIECCSEILDIRWVTDSGGHRERRFVIQTLVLVGAESWPIDITLTNRDMMRFRMLLGRSALKNRFLVDPAVSYLMQKVENS